MAYKVMKAQKVTAVKAMKATKTVIAKAAKAKRAMKAIKATQAMKKAMKKTKHVGRKPSKKQVLPVRVGKRVVCHMSMEKVMELHEDWLDAVSWNASFRVTTMPFKQYFICTKWTYCINIDLSFCSLC